MYLTAQRVRSWQTGKSGTNVFWFRHPEGLPSGVGWPLLGQLVAQQAPGRLFAESIEVPPEGNEVLSFLDVVTTDDVAPTTVEQALASFQAQLEDRASREDIPGVWLRLMTVTALIHQRREEFFHLREQLLALFHNPHHTSLKPDQKPLRIERSTNQEGYTFSLRTSDVERLKLGTGWVPPVMSCSFEEWSNLNDLTPLGRWERLLPILTGMELPALLPLGGVEVVEMPGGDLVWRWPNLHP